MDNSVYNQLKVYLKRKEVQYGFLFMIIMLLYFRTIYFDFNLDDHIIIDVISGKVNSLKDLFGIFKLSYNHTDYRPIVLLSYGIEELLLGSIRPAVAHGINVFLFFLICISALKLFRLIFDDTSESLLFAAVILFSVHPLNTEVVCSLKCRDNLISMLFGLNAFIFFMYFLNQDKRKIIHLSICILFSFIALLSKMDAIGFLLFGISYLFFYKTGKKTVYILIGIAAVFILFSVVSAIPGMLFSTDASTALKGKVTFTENPLALDFTIMNRCIAFTNTIFFYFTKLVPVSGFRYYYGYNYYAILSTTSFSFVGGLFILSSFIIILFFAFTKKQKTIVLSIFGVFLCSLYALNFIAPVAGIIADRYVFIANLFFCLFIASLLRFILLYLNKPTLIRHTFTIVAIIFFVISILRIPAWKNFKTLIDTDAQALSDSYEAMRIAAGAYFKEYESETNETAKQTYLDKSIYYAKKGVQVYPKNFLLYLFLGQYYFKANQPDKAIQSFKSSIKNDTSTADGFVYLGDVFYALKKPDSAIFYYKNGLHIEPKSQILINNISSIYYELNDKENCLKFNNDLLAKDSTTFAAHENLGYFYLDSKDTLQAISYFKSAVKYGLDATSLPIKIQ